MTTTSILGAAGAAAASGNKSSLTSAAEQEDRFMKLLVAQMKNQDPLNPMDNAQMTSQIAQINTVGGIEKLNTTVQSLLASFDTLLAQSALQLPGRNVLVAGQSLTLTDGHATGGVELAGAADAVNVEILDASGAVVKSIALGASSPGVRSFSWDGTLAHGQPAADGAWRMRVTASNGGQPVQASTLAAVRVLSVSNTASGVQLDLGSAGVLPATAVKSFL
jgi:flagellar basal-body rod modification protein FlgD